MTLIKIVEIGPKYGQIKTNFDPNVHIWTNGFCPQFFHFLFNQAAISLGNLMDYDLPIDEK